MSTNEKRTAFPIVSRMIGDTGQFRPHIVALCKTCEWTEAIPISKHSGNVPSTVGERLFRKRFWKMGASRTRDECPRCHVSAQAQSQLPPLKFGDKIVVELKNLTEFKEPVDIDAEVTAMTQKSKKGRGDGVKAYWANMTPEERSAQAVRRADTRAAKKAAAQAQGAPSGAFESAPDAVEPRQPRGSVEPFLETDDISLTHVEKQLRSVGTIPTPTREDNLRLFQAISDVYDIHAQRYKGSTRDAALADKLDVPPLWVATVREQFFGPDRSAVGEGVTKGITAAWIRLDGVEQKLLEAMDAIDKERETLKKLAADNQVTLPA